MTQDRCEPPRSIQSTLLRAGQVVARSLPGLTVLVGFVLALRKLDDFDTWWHLASGRWIATNLRVPHTDTLSFTVPDHPWTNLQWAYDLLLYGCHRLGGEVAVCWFAAGCFTIAVWLLVRNVRRSLGPVATALLVGWTLLVAQERFLIRPEMFSFVFFELLVGFVLFTDGSERRRWWWVPVIMLAWVNTHALFIIGVFCLACRAGAELLSAAGLLPRALRPETTAGGRRTILGASAVAAVVTVVNPYGVEGVLFPFHLWSRINGSNSVFQAIGEFRKPFSSYYPTFSVGAYQSLFYLSCLAVLAALIAAVATPGRRRRRGFDAGGIVLFAAIAYLSVMARRNMGLFAFGAVPVVAAAMATLGDRLPERMRWWVRPAAPVGAAAVAAMGLWLVVYVAGNGYYRDSDVTHEFGAGVFSSNFPVEAARFARETRLPGPVYNDLSAGGYLTWSPAAPGGVFIDGRLEVYDTEFFSRYMSALSNPARWRSEAERFGINTVLLFHRWGNRRPLIYALWRDPAWEPVYYDETAVIFVRRAGHEQALDRARKAWPQWNARTQTRVAAPARRWPWPVDRATAIDSFGTFLFAIGRVDDGIELYKRLLALGLPARKEASIRLALGYRLARRGQRNEAVMHLKRAARLDPDNRRIAQALKDLGVDSSGL